MAFPGFLPRPTTQTKQADKTVHSQSQSARGRKVSYFQRVNLSPHLPNFNPSTLHTLNSFFSNSEDDTHPITYTKRHANAKPIKLGAMTSRQATKSRIKLSCTKL